MNKYHIEIIAGKNIYKREVVCDGYDYGSTGTYYFYKIVESNSSITKRQVIAHYPIDRTIIANIEYDINE